MPHINELIIREISTETIPEIVKIRTRDWGTDEAYWDRRIRGYLDCTSNPTDALNTRIIYVAMIGGVVVGFIAGHLTSRFGCQGELQWINVIPDWQEKGIASQLIKKLAQWFVANNAFKVCIDAGSEEVRQFYSKNGATMLNNHWMYWEDIRTSV
jgi:GNAT superfamily N-acetyltransferase